MATAKMTTVKTTKTTNKNSPTAGTKVCGTCKGTGRVKK